MTHTTRPVQLAQAIYSDATVVATLLLATIHRLDAELAGWPTSTPGAAPSSGGPGTYDPLGAVTLTPTEKLAGTPDRARTNLDELIKGLEHTQRQMSRLAAIVVAYGMPGVDGTSVAKRLVVVDQSIWCRNCSRHGVRNPRAEGRTECRPCHDFRLTYGVEATAAIIDRRERGNLNSADIERLLDRDVNGWRKKRPKQQKAG